PAPRRTDAVALSTPQSAQPFQQLITVGKRRPVGQMAVRAHQPQRRAGAVACGKLTALIAQYRYIKVGQLAQTFCRLTTTDDDGTDPIRKLARHPVRQSIG